MPSANVAEVARWHGKGNLLIVRFRGQEIALEVINDLRRDTRPVDRIDRTNLVLGLEGGIVGDRLHDVLRIIEQAGHGDIEDIGILQRIHLGALEGAHLAVRREHENLDVMLAAHGVFGGRAGVAGGSAQNIDRFTALVEHVLEQIAKQLHGHVLEGQCRTVGQFLRVKTLFQFGQRRDLRSVTTVTGMTIDRGSVSFSDNGLQISRGDIGDELGQDFVGQIGIRQRAPGIEFSPSDLRVAFRQVKAAIRGQTTEENVAKSRSCGVTAGR